MAHTPLHTVPLLLLLATLLASVTALKTKGAVDLGARRGYRDAISADFDPLEDVVLSKGMADAAAVRGRRKLSQRMSSRSISDAAADAFMSEEAASASEPVASVGARFGGRKLQGAGRGLLLKKYKPAAGVSASEQVFSDAIVGDADMHARIVGRKLQGAARGLLLKKYKPAASVSASEQVFSDAFVGDADMTARIGRKL